MNEKREGKVFVTGSVLETVKVLAFSFCFFVDCKGKVSKT